MLGKKGNGRLLAGLGASILLLGPSTVAAHQGHSDSTAHVPPIIDRVVGGDVVATDSGLFAARTDDGQRFTTHGPDFAASHGATIGPGDPERAPFCAPDPANDYFQHVLYAHPTSRPNRVGTETETIRSSIRRIDHVLDEDSRASGGPRGDYIVRCSGGEIAVDSFSVPSGDAQAEFTEIIAAAAAAGFNNPRVDYSIFYDGPGNAGACGIGTVSDDDRLIADNANNNSRSSADYAASFEGCWTGDTPMHENGHNQGAVQRFAPNSTGAGGWHCNQASDVMCYSPDGGEFNQNGEIPCSTGSSIVHFDCGWNTYFDSAPEPGEWLADHWNIGSPLNRFLAFTPTAGGSDAFASAPDLGTSRPVVRATGITSSATKEAGEPAHGGSAGGKSVWYRWTPSRTVPVTVDTCGSNFDTLLGIYVGAGVTAGSLTRVAESDDSVDCGLGSKVSFVAQGGTTYRIAVDGFRYEDGSVAAGDIRLTLDEANEAPLAGYTSACSKLTCTFTDTSTDSDSAIAARTWVFGDGGSDSGTTVRHTFGGDGSYDVTLTATDEFGAADFETQNFSFSGFSEASRDRDCDKAKRQVEAAKKKLRRARASGGRVAIKRARAQVRRTKERKAALC